MAYTHPWDTAAPPDTQLAKLGAQDFRDLKVDIPQRLFLSGPIGSRPTPEAVFAGVVYFSTDEAKLYRWTGGVWADITSTFLAGSTHPSCKVRRASPYSLASGLGGTAIPFDTEIWDPANLHDGIPSNSVVHLNTVGKWLIFASATLDSTTATQVGAKIRLSGSTDPAIHVQRAVVATYADFNLSTIIDIPASRYIELIMFHDSGVPKDVLSNAENSPMLGAYFLGT